MRSRPARRARVWSALVLLLPLLFAGCTSDGAAPDSGPLTLLEAHRLAHPMAETHAASAHLVGFVGHEGRSPGFLSGLLAEYRVDADTSADTARGDGHAAAWALLYGTSEGRLLRVVVRDAPRSIEAMWAEGAPSDLVRQLWAMNLGGRLIEDSPQVVRSLAAADARIAGFLTEFPDADVVYASTVAPVDGPGTEDLLYEVFFAEPGRAADGFALYGQVHHFTGFVIASGDASEAQRLQRVTLVDESFTLGPLPREVEQQEELPRRVEDAVLHLNVTQVGAYVVELLGPSERAVASIEGRVVDEPVGHTERLGVLLPGSYTLRIEVNGRVGFDLRIDGTIGL